MIRFENEVAHTTYVKFHNHYRDRIRDCDFFIKKHQYKAESLLIRGQKKAGSRLSKRISRVKKFRNALQKFTYLQEWGTATGHIMSVSMSKVDDREFSGGAMKQNWDEWGLPNGEHRTMVFGFVNHGINWKNPDWGMHT